MIADALYPSIVFATIRYPPVVVDKNLVGGIMTIGLEIGTLVDKNVVGPLIAIFKGVDLASCLGEEVLHDLGTRATNRRSSRWLAGR